MQINQIWMNEIKSDFIKLCKLYGCPWGYNIYKSVISYSILQRIVFMFSTYEDSLKIPHERACVNNDLISGRLMQYHFWYLILSYRMLRPIAIGCKMRLARKFRSSLLTAIALLSFVLKERTRVCPILFDSEYSSLYYSDFYDDITWLGEVIFFTDFSLIKICGVHSHNCRWQICIAFILHFLS